MKNEEIIVIGDKLQEMIRSTSQFNGFIMPRELAVDLLNVAEFALELNGKPSNQSQPGKHLIGMAVTPSLRSHLYFGLVGIVRGVSASKPVAGQPDRALQLQIWIVGTPSDRRLTECGDYWQTA